MGSLLQAKPCAVLCHLLLAACMFVLPTTSYGGSGKFDNGVYDFCVSVRFDATEEELEQIRQAFEAGSNVFADALDGQQRFGTVTIVNNSGASEIAEYWVHPGRDRAHATYGRYGERGQHVNLYFDSNFQQRQGADGDAFTIAHEHIHHAFNVQDEYSGPGGENAGCPASPSQMDLSYSLMDNFFTKGGNFPAGNGQFSMKELCVDSNHDPNGDTWQDTTHGTSAWSTIADHPTRSATPPSGLPDETPPTPHSVSFGAGATDLRAMLVIDRSGSMASQNRLEFAKRGGKLFVGRLKDGSSIGVASFSCSTSVDYPLTTIDDRAVRTAAKNVIDGLSATGSTNIGGGLLAGLSAIQARSDRSCNEVMVLLSDGDHNCGTAPMSALPAIRSEGVTVMTVGVGNGISASGQATLQDIAQATSGKYYRVDDSSRLVGLYLRVVAESQGRGLLYRVETTLSSGQVLALPVLVEEGATSATFSLALGEAGDQIDLALESPSGEMIDEQVAAGDPDIDFATDINSRLFEVRNPEPGIWSMVASAGTVISGVIEAQAFAEHAGAQLLLAANPADPVYPQPLVLEATPTFDGKPVLAVELQGTMLRPDGSSAPVSFFDDGDAAHGDTQAGDGIYSALFDAYTEDGTYSIEAIATSTEASKTAPGDSLYAHEPSSSELVPRYQRLTTLSTVVTGTPGLAQATVEYMPEPINYLARGRFVDAYIEPQGNGDASTIEPDTLKITTVDGNTLSSPIVPEAGFAEVGDFDSDGTPDLHIRFDRDRFRDVVPPGTRTLVLEGRALGQLFQGERTVSVVGLSLQR